VSGIMTSEGFCQLRCCQGSACLNGLGNDPDRKTPPAGELVGLEVKQLCEYPPWKQAHVVYSPKLNNPLTITDLTENCLAMTDSQ
jgi:hypothetical protein